MTDYFVQAIFFNFIFSVKESTCVNAHYAIAHSVQEIQGEEVWSGHQLARGQGGGETFVQI